VLPRCAGGAARLWDARTGATRDEVLQHSGDIFGVGFSPDGKTGCTANFGGVRLWDIATYVPQGAPIEYGMDVRDTAFSSNGQTVLTGYSDGTVRIWPVPPPAIYDREHPERLQLSVEVRTGKRLDDAGGVQKLTFDEWNTRRLALEKLGGPCDQPTWEQYNAWKSKQAPTRRSPASRP
jgi:WD40 repeat protein